MRIPIIIAAVAVIACSVVVGAQSGGRQGRGGAPAQTTAASAKAPTSPVTGNAVTGKKLYFDYACYSCHGFNGETGARPFVPNWPANLATESSFTAFLRGRANVAPGQPSTSMPNYAAATLTDRQTKDIYAYIRTFKSSAPPSEQIAPFKQILAAAEKPYKP
jgi:mono/diheme cytochrome c family protein